VKPVFDQEGKLQSFQRFPFKNKSIFDKEDFSDMLQLENCADSQNSSKKKPVAH
jgi:hypothetical protein